MIVVDTNVIGSLYLTSERSEQAETALRKDWHWAAPLLWRSELRNVLVSYVRRNWLSLEDAQEIMDETIGLMHGREYEVASLEVLRLAAGSQCTASDCEFVALAQELGVPLITVDKQVLSAFPQIAVSLEAFARG